MYIYITFVVLPIATNMIACESTSEMPKDLQHKTAQRTSAKEPTVASALQNTKSSNNSNIKTLLSYQSAPIEPRKRGEPEDYNYKVPMTPSQLTKLAKSLFLGFDPSFSKDYFEPFERRPRPVTLVAFRKNGLQAKHVLRHNDKIKSLDVAELQSPYNGIGHFWQDEPGEP